MFLLKKNSFLIAVLCTMLIPIIITIKNKTLQSYTTIRQSAELLPYVENLSKNTLILFDIDDTLITPISRTFASPYKNMIDKIKSSKDKYSNYEEIISTWRLSRKIKLTDLGWPDIINGLKKHFHVYALTKMDTGKVGHIQSTEIWRYNELASLGLFFTSDSSALEKQNGSTLFKGIVFTGKCKKSEALRNHLAISTCPHIVMIDDRSEHLDDIKQFCKINNIPFTGIRFDIPQVEVHPDIPKIQHYFLTQKNKWLEDDEAMKEVQFLERF
ncbi:MAG TPA: hypothetical protein DIC42_02465 [Holosporales bacterium]|nr:hypothetical protein [Holosporales bacterium]